ncbi:PepSY domain-containing protein [Paraburkholderia sacchari]|uniref:PepSY domain-containing protein n=1 Tax=Paraburkholderia sacchari TaxID=159450 RepID=UPI0039A5C440
MNRSRLAKRCALALVVLGSAAGIGAALAGESCSKPIGDWKPVDAVYAMAGQKRWHIDKLKVDDGCYQIKGSDANGRRFKAKLDPVTLDVVRIKRDGEHDDEGKEHDGDKRRQLGETPGSAVDAGAAPASAGAPSGGLLTPGSKPDVQIR